MEEGKGEGPVWVNIVCSDFVMVYGIQQVLDRTQDNEFIIINRGILVPAVQGRIFIILVPIDT